MGLSRVPSPDMSSEDDYLKPLLLKHDLPTPESTVDRDRPFLNHKKQSNGSADIVLDIAVGEDSETDDHSGLQQEDTSSFDNYDNGHIEEDLQEISASGQSFERPLNDDLHGLYSFLGSQPTLGPMPTVDPFRNQSEEIGSIYEWIKLVLCLPLAIIRLLLITLIVLGGISVAKLLLLGWNEKIVPMSKWRRRAVYITRLLARLILFCCGYHWIRRLGKPCKREIAPIVVSNHVSFIDPIFFFFELLPSFVSSASHSNLPGLGMIIRPMQVINVDRSSADSKKAALKEIRSRAMSNNFPHVMLFPEGTTTNGRALIFFQLGAFMPGVPVQPVLLRYPFVHFDNSWGRISILKLLLRMLTQFHNFMEVEYLPILHPSPREKDHPTLFAKKVKRVMAKALNVPSTNHSYGDLVLTTKVANRKTSSSVSYMVEMAKMEKLFHINTREAGGFLAKFQALDTKHMGYLTEDQFLDNFDLPKATFSQQIFGFFDKEDEGSVSFREFLAGSAFILKHPSFESLCRTSFEFCDINKQGFLGRSEVERSLRLVCQDITPMQVEKWERKLDVDGDGVISWDDFRAFLEQHPEFLAVFLPPCV